MTDRQVLLMTYGIFFLLGFFVGKMANKNIVFGITLPDELLVDQEVKAIKTKFYRRYTCLLGTLLVVCLYLDGHNHHIAYIFAYIGTWLFVTPLLFAQANKGIKTIKGKKYKPLEGEDYRSASLVKRQVRHSHSFKAFLIPLAISLGTGLATLVHYRQIPDKIPMHYDYSGQVTRYGDKSFGTLSILLWTQVFLTLLIMGSTYASLKWSKQRLSSRRPKTSEYQKSVANKRFILVMALTAACVNLTFTGIQLQSIGLIHLSPGVFNGLIYGTMLPLFGLIIWFYLTTGQSGERLKVKALEEETGPLSLNDQEDDYWKAGLVYYNKNDSAMFVTKRFGGGYTINFGNPRAVGLLVLILLAIGGGICWSVFL